MNSAHSIDRSKEKGFALALSLALLSFLALLILALVALIGVEARVAEATKSHRLAREHAKVALQIALGQLKETLGPDRRVTARGDFLNYPDDPTVEGGKRYWTGVWESNDPTIPPVWLVSGEDPDPQASASDDLITVPLVGSTGDSSAEDDRVLAPSVEVHPNSLSPIPTGRYAYWVGDEGVKAKLNLPQGNDARVASSFGISAIDDFDRFNENVDGEIRDRLLSNGQLLALDFTSKDAVETLARNFHDVTLHSKGVIANVKGGGLRKDLTAGLQFGAVDGNGDAVLSGKPIFDAMGDDSDSGGSGDDGSQGMGFIPGLGFPELAGFTMMNNIRMNPDGTCRPTRGKPRSLFPFNNRCRMGDVYAPYSYTLYIEDLDSGGIDRNRDGELIGDLKLDFMRMSDGSIMVNLDYTTGAGYNHTIVDNYGMPIQGLTQCHCSRWRNGEVFSGVIGGGKADLSNDPGAPMWDQLRDFYNLRASGNSIATRHQTEAEVGIYPVISTAQFFYCPTMQDYNGQKYVNSHVMPAIVLWNPYDVDVEPNEYTVAVWGKENGLGDEYKVYYNNLNVCERNYYQWEPTKAGGPDGRILDQRKALVDIKGRNPKSGYPRARWPYIDTDGEIGIDLIGPCRYGKVWTMLDTVPGETYEVRFPFGINKDDRPRPYVRRGIASWDGVEMATFEGNTELFNYGTPQDYVTFSAVATKQKTRFEFRSDVFNKEDGGGYRHSNNGTRTCQGVTIGICTIKSSSGYPASKTVKTGFHGGDSTGMNKMSFVLRNVSGLKAGQAMVFTPGANHQFKQYQIGQSADNFLEEGWHGGYSFHRRTSTYFDSDEPPTHAETWINGVQATDEDQINDDVFLALFEGNVDVDSSYEDPLLVISQANFIRQTDPETYPIQTFSSSSRFDSDELSGVEGRKYSMRFTAAGTGILPPGAPSGSDRIRWLANYNPRATILAPSPYEHEDETGSMPISGIGTVPNYYTYVARVQDDEWNVSVSGSDDRPFVGYSHQGGPVKGVLFEIPKDENHFRSIGQLMHANLSAPGHDLYKYNLTFEPSFVSSRYAMRGLGYQPAYAIGNSLADPRILLDRRSQNLSDNDMLIDGNAVVCDAGMHYDYSYLINDALWDSYFFSTVPRDIDSDDLGDPLPNPRIKVHYNRGMTPEPEDLLGYDTSAANLMIDGAFNVNSTSQKAWAALLASFFGTEVQTTQGSSEGSYGESPFLRMDHPHGGPVEQDADSSSDETYAGFRKLDVEEIDNLAAAIVAQIRLRPQRGSFPRPFTSLGEFVNRLVPNEEDDFSSGDQLQFALKGLLQAAIDNAGLNERFIDEVVPEGAHLNFDVTLDGTLPKPGGSTASAGPTASHAPGYLTQADILARLGPCLAARSDTFRVRAYGEALHPVDGAVEAKAWCEAIYQRVPETDLKEDESSSDNSEWTGLHRQFKLIHFRWLSPEEI